jgi:hypothetical protein
MASEDSTAVNEYVQLLGMYPFRVMFYTEQQIRIYCDLCRDVNSSTLCFGSTGYEDLTTRRKRCRTFMQC